MRITRGSLRTIIREMILNEQAYDSLSHGAVISAVDNALRVLDISNSTLAEFMIRIARTESGGSHDAVWVASQPEGADLIVSHTADPFQLDLSATSEVKTNVNMRHWRDFFDKQREKGIVRMGPLTAQGHSEIESNEKLGAIFATLYVIWRIGASISRTAWNPDKRADIGYFVPADLDTQALFWKSEYNTSSGAGELCDFTEKNGGAHCPEEG
jgi:hypothetical protein